MSLPSVALIDAGPLIAFYNRRDQYHAQVLAFLQSYRGKLVTTDACLTEAMYSLSRSHLVQMELSRDVADGIWQRETLLQQDFIRITELLNRYCDLPADFADLSLVVLSERLNIPAIVSLDSDFYTYRRYRKEPFQRIFIPN
jgi:uncharacterized protein